MATKKKNKIEKNISDEVFKEAVDDFDRFEDFVQTNLNKIVIGSVIIVIALIIGYVVYMQIENAKNEASVALTSAKTIEELNAAIKKYPDSVTDEAAKLNLGTQYFNDAKYNEALKTYQELGASAQPGEVKNRARLNEAYTMEAMKDQEKAADKFAMIALDATAPEYIRNEANYSAARLFVALKKPERAKSCLKAINSEDPNDFWASQAQRLLQRVDTNEIAMVTKPVVIKAPAETAKPVKEKMPTAKKAAPEATKKSDK